MKKILIFLFTAICIAGCTTSGYIIVGEVSNDTLNGKTIFIKERINREWIAIDSTVIKNGTFTFKGTLDTAKIAYIVYEFPSDNRVKQAFVLENGKLNVKIDTAGFMEFKGTTQNELLQNYQNDKKGFYKKADAFYNTRKDSTKTPEQKLRLAQETKKLNLEEVAIDKKFSTEHINTLAGTHVFMNSFFGMNVDEKEAIIKLMNDETKKVERIREIIADIQKEKTLAVGSQFTDFKLPSLTGDSISLSSLIGKTDYVLVDFWASWCSSCMGSLPELKELYKTYKGSTFEILGVSLDENKAAWSSTIAKQQIDWKHVSDLKGWKSTGAQIYAVNSIPSTVLINKNGKIVGKNLSIPEIEKLLRTKLIKK